LYKRRVSLPHTVVLSKENSVYIVKKDRFVVHDLLCSFANAFKPSRKGFATTLLHGP
jgi:hypothetical protein